MVIPALGNPYGKQTVTTPVTSPVTGTRVIPPMAAPVRTTPTTTVTPAIKPVSTPKTNLIVSSNQQTLAKVGGAISSGWNYLSSAVGNGIHSLVTSPKVKPQLENLQREMVKLQKYGFVSPVGETTTNDQGKEVSIATKPKDWFDEVNKYSSIYLNNFYSGFTGGTFKSEIPQKTVPEKVAGAVGNISGAAKMITNITGVFESLVGKSATIASVIEKYPKVSKILMPIVKNIVGFDLYGQIDPAQKNRAQRLLVDTALGGVTGGLGFIRNAPLSVASNFALGYGIAKASGASNEDAIITGGVLAVIDTGNRVQQSLLQLEITRKGARDMTPQEARNAVIGTPLEKTSVGKEILKASLEADQTGGKVRLSVSAEKPAVVAEILGNKQPATGQVDISVVPSDALLPSPAGVAAKGTELAVKPSGKPIVGESGGVAGIVKGKPSTGGEIVKVQLSEEKYKFKQDVGGNAPPEGNAITTNGKVIGGYYIDNGYDMPEGTARLEHIEIKPEFQRKGYGIQAIKQIFMDNPDIQILKGQGIIQSKKFWEKIGQFREPGSSSLYITREKFMKDFGTKPKPTYYPELLAEAKTQKAENPETLAKNLTYQYNTHQTVIKPALDTIAHSVADKIPGAYVAEAPLKGTSSDGAFKPTRSIQKMIAGGIKDISRNTIVVKNQSDLPKAIAELQKNKDIISYPEKNLFDSPSYMGYRGVIFNYKDPESGLMGEIQMNIPEVLYVKEKPEISKLMLSPEDFARLQKINLKAGAGHAAYEIVRNYEEVAKREGRTYRDKNNVLVYLWTPEEEVIVRPLIKSSNEAYAEALDLAKSIDSLKEAGKSSKETTLPVSMKSASVPAPGSTKTAEPPLDKGITAANLPSSEKNLGASIPESIISPKQPEINAGAPGKGISRFQERIQEQLLTIDQGKYEFDPKSGKYNKLNLERDAKKAIDFLEANPKEALRIALGLENPPSGQTANAISVATALKARQEGNFELWKSLITKISLRNTRFGQEIVSLRGQFNDNSPENFIKKVLDARMDALGRNIVTDIEKTVGKRPSSKTKAVEKIDRQVEKLSKHMKDAQVKIKLAQDIIDSLICP